MPFAMLGRRGSPCLRPLKSRADVKTALGDELASLKRPCTPAIVGCLEDHNVQILTPESRMFGTTTSGSQTGRGLVADVLRGARQKGTTGLSLETLRIGPTTALFEGGPRAGVGVTMFVLRTAPGRFVEMHTHPYPETFLLLDGWGRWTIGDAVTELEAEAMITAPTLTPHGLRNVGETPLLVVTVQESPTLKQTFLGREPA